MIKTNQDSANSAIFCQAEIGVNMMRILLCDDNAVFLKSLRCEIRRVLDAYHVEAVIHTIDTPEDITDNLLASCDVFFLDIDFSGRAYNGIDVAKLIRRHKADAIIIFVTNFVEYALEGYEVQAFRYALKNEIPQKLEQYLLETMDKLKAEQEPIQINIAGETVTLQLVDILYIESQGHTAVIHTQKNGMQTSKTYRFYASLTSLEQQLAPHGFLRIHKSYLVNMRRMKKYQCTEAILDNGMTLRVSEKNYAAQKKQYLRWKGRW